MKIEEIKHNFAQNLYRLRKSRNLNQIQLGEEIHYSSKAISKWENEETIPDIDVLTDVADYFGVTVDELISSHDVVKKSFKARNRFFISASSALLPFFLGLVIFFILKLANTGYEYLSFVAASMASSIVLIVFTSLWYGKMKTYLAIVYLIVATMLLLMLLLNFQLWWLLLIIAIALAILFLVFFKIHFPKKENK